MGVVLFQTMGGKKIFKGVPSRNKEGVVILKTETEGRHGRGGKSGQDNFSPPIPTKGVSGVKRGPDS